MTNVDELEAALHRWGQEQRGSADASSAPAIADLLGDRRRRHTLVATAASVVLVAALALALGLGLRSNGTSSTGVPHQNIGSSNAATTPDRATDKPCWRQFVDAGSAFHGTAGRGIVTLRYEGSSTCGVSDQPQLVVVSTDGRVTGPDKPPKTPSGKKITRTTVAPGQSIRFAVAVSLACPSVPSGRYILRALLRPTAHPSATSGVAGPVVALRPSDVDRTMGCPSGRPTAGLTSDFTVLSAGAASTLALLTRIARQEAADDGDPSASAEAVRTTYAPAERLLGDPASQPGSNAAVWIIQLHGSLSDATSYRGPGTAVGSRFSEAAIVVLARNLMTVAQAFGPRSYALSKLGTVVPLIP